MLIFPIGLKIVDAYINMDLIKVMYKYLIDSEFLNDFVLRKTNPQIRLVLPIKKQITILSRDTLQSTLWGKSFIQTKSMLQ